MTSCLCFLKSEIEIVGISSSLWPRADAGIKKGR
jgi:hypothetical protein